MAAEEDKELPGYRSLGVLGRGSYGEADLFQDEKTEQLVAVKFLRNSQIDDQLQMYIKREIRNHQLLCGHPSVIQLRKVFLTPGYVGIAMEYAAGGDLMGRVAAVGRFPEEVARYFFQQLIEAVAWCHSKGVVHRDLKLQNLLMDKQVPSVVLQEYEKLLERRPQLKLCDFGTSKSTEFDTRPDTLLGTPAYSAPELIASKGRRYSGEAVDVWACGVTLYFMLVGDMPFLDQSGKVSPRLVHAAAWVIPDGVEVSKSCEDLLSRIFVIDPEHRITLAGIQRHPWFRKNLPREEGAAREPPRRSCWLCFCGGGGEDAEPRIAPAPAVPLVPCLNQSEEEIDQLLQAARSSGSKSTSPNRAQKAAAERQGLEDGSFMSDDALVTMGGTVF